MCEFAIHDSMMCFVESLARVVLVLDSVRLYTEACVCVGSTWLEFAVCVCVCVCVLFH